MKLVLFGGNGFFGSNARVALAKKHEVVTVAREPHNVDYALDLTYADDIDKVLIAEQPEVIVNCAGIVENNEKARLNVVFTSNLFESIKRTGIMPKRFIVSGSASEYGVVSETDLPIKETNKIAPISPYGKSKTEEVAVALQYGKELGIEVVIARIFNPLGSGMHERMLLPNLIRQAHDIKAGKREGFELSRLDAKRDYIDIRDVSEAINILTTSTLNHSVYNIGTGVVTENRDIIEGLCGLFEIPGDIPVLETSNSPEPLLACQADITRIQADTGWAPEHTLIETLQGVLREDNN